MSYDLCLLPQAKKPYYIENIRTNIYSLEELCFYLYNNACLIDETLMNERLLDWLRDELGLKKLYRQLYEQLEKKDGAGFFILPIFREAGYLTNTQMREYQEELAKLEVQSADMKQLVPRPNGNKCVSPWALIWREENYYLAAYDSEDRVIKHYRVDKMGQAEVTDLPREGVEQFSQIDVTSYTNQTFGMFAGEESVVTMEFPVRLTGVVLDRFGRETDIRPMSEEVFRIRAKVAVSGQFFGWLAGIGQGARIVAPEAVQKRYVQWLSDILREQSQEAE